MSLGRKSNGVGHAGIRFEANRLAMARRVDDTLRKVRRERLRERAAARRILQARSHQAVCIGEQMREYGVELMLS